MSLYLALYVLALWAGTAAIVYGIVRPERPRSAAPAVRPLPSDAVGPKRPRRLAA